MKIPLLVGAALLLTACQSTSVQQTVEITPDQYRQFTTYEGDLNGDGSNEVLTFTRGETAEGNPGYTLSIGETSITGVDDNLAGYFGVVDLDKGDTFKQIAVSNYGPSSDYSTNFYQYDGKELTSMGTVPGLYEEMGFDGAGNISTYVRGSILDTWFFPATFAVFGDGDLAMVEEDLAYRYTPVTMLQPMDFVVSPTDSTVAFSLAVGDRATIVACDNVAWCQVSTDDGQEGWFEVENYNGIKGTDLYSGDVFDGLSFAD